MPDMSATVRAEAVWPPPIVPPRTIRLLHGDENAVPPPVPVVPALPVVPPRPPAPIVPAAPVAPPRPPAPVVPPVPLHGVSDSASVADPFAASDTDEIGWPA